MPSDKFTHIPVRKELRETLRKEAQATGKTYTGVLEALWRTRSRSLSKNDTEYLIEKFCESVAEEVGVTPQAVESAVRDALPEDYR